MNKLIGFGAVLISLVVMDFLWIGLTMNQFYLNEFRTFGRISGGKLEPVLWAAGVVYLLIAAGLFVFVLPSSVKAPWGETLFRGAFLGFCVYGIYDFTNLATIQNYSIRLSVVDMAWGTFLCAVAGGVGRIVLERFT